MALNFPSSPSLNQTYSVGTKTWKWNGYAWDLYSSANASFESLVVTGNTVSQHIIPSANVTYDLGSNTNRFRDLYLSGNTINLGDATVSANGTAIDLPAGTKVGNKSLAFEDITTVSIDTAITSSDSGLNIYKTSRYKDVVLSEVSSVTIDSISTYNFNSVSSSVEERFNTTMVCDNTSDILITLPAANSVTVGFNITIHRLNTGNINVENSPETNDFIRYAGWKFDTLKILYVEDRQLSEFQNTKLSGIATLYSHSVNEFDGKYTFKYTCISNTSYMLSV